MKKTFLLSKIMKMKTKNIIFLSLIISTYCFSQDVEFSKDFIEHSVKVIRRAYLHHRDERILLPLDDDFAINKKGRVIWEYSFYIFNGDAENEVKMDRVFLSNFGNHRKDNDKYKIHDATYLENRIYVIYEKSGLIFFDEFILKNGIWIHFSKNNVNFTGDILFRPPELENSKESRIKIQVENFAIYFDIKSGLFESEQGDPIDRTSLVK